MSFIKSKSRAAAIIVFVIAFSLRLGIAVAAFKNFPLDFFWLKGFEVVHVAESIVSGEGFSSPFGIESGPTAWTSPLYTYFVAAVFRIFGVYSAYSAYFLVFVNILMETSSAVLICIIGEEYFGKFVGFVAATAYALSLGEMYFVLKVWDTSAATFLLTVAIYLYLEYLPNDSILRWSLWGAFWGCAVLVSPQLMLVLLLLTGVAARRRKAWNNSAISVLVCVAVLAPWTARNFVVFRHLIPVRSNFGFELWLGNHEGAGYINDTSLHPLGSRNELDAYKSMGEFDYIKSRELQAHHFIQQFPAKFMRDTVQRIYSFWSGPEQIWLAVTLFAVIGVYFGARENPSHAMPFAIAILICPLPYYITHSESWYRHPIEPSLYLMCSYAAMRLARLISGNLPEVGSRFTSERQ